MDPKVGVTRPRGRQAQKVKALAQHKDSVTRVTECHHVSLPNDSRPGGPRSQVLNGVEGKVGVLEETQREGRRQASWLTAGVGPAPLPSCRACPPCRKVGHTNCSEAWPGRPTHMAGGCRHSRSPTVDLFQHGHSVASQGDTLLAGLPTSPQLGTDLGRRMPAARLPPAG